MDPSERARYWHDRGFVAYKQARYDLALSLFARAFRVAQQQGLEEIQAYCLQDSGLVHQDLGRYQKAARRYQAAAEISIKIGNIRHTSWAHYQHAICLLYGGHIEAAEERLHHSEDIAGRIGDRSHIAAIQHALSLIDLVGGALPRAIRRCRQNLAYTVETGETEFDGMDWQQIGVCCAEGRRWSAARVCLHRAQKSYLKVGDRESLGEAQAYLTLTELESGNLVLANEFAASLSRLARKSRMPEYHSRMDFVTALVAYHSGDRQKATANMAAAFDVTVRYGLRIAILDLVVYAARAGINELPSPLWREMRNWSFETYRRLGNKRRCSVLQQGM